jgi:hypothetical protein
VSKATYHSAKETTLTFQNFCNRQSLAWLPSQKSANSKSLLPLEWVSFDTSLVCTEPGMAALLADMHPPPHMTCILLLIWHVPSSSYDMYPPPTEPGMAALLAENNEAKGDLMVRGLACQKRPTNIKRDLQVIKRDLQGRLDANGFRERD